jgi:hypothetical protein
VGVGVVSAEMKGCTITDTRRESAGLRRGNIGAARRLCVVCMKAAARHGPLGRMHLQCTWELGGGRSCTLYCTQDVCVVESAGAAANDGGHDMTWRWGLSKMFCENDSSSAPRATASLPRARPRPHSQFHTHTLAHTHTLGGTSTRPSDLPPLSRTRPACSSIEPVSPPQQHAVRSLHPSAWRAPNLCPYLYPYPQ